MSALTIGETYEIQNSSMGMTQLFNAIQQRQSYEAIENLFISGTDVSYKNTEGMTLLKVAVSQGNPDVVKLLLGHGKNVQVTISTRAKQSANTFFYSTFHPNIGSPRLLQLLELLLEQGLKLSEADEYPTIPNRVLQTITFDLFLKLLGEEMVVHDVTEENCPFPLISALNNPDDRIWKYILDHKLVDLDERDCVGQTILMVMASYSGSGVEILLKAGADPNSYDELMRTPLTLSMYKLTVTRNFKALFSVSNDSNITLAYAKALSSNLPAYNVYMVKSIAKLNYLNPLRTVSHLSNMFGAQFDILFQASTHELEDELSQNLTDHITLRDILFTGNLEIYLSNNVLCQGIQDAVQRSPLVHYQLELSHKANIIRKMYNLKVKSEIQLSKLLNCESESYPEILNKIAGYLNVVDFINLCKIETMRK